MEPRTVINTSVDLPIELHRRTKALSKRLRLSINQIVRDSLTERIEFLENKLRAEEERKRADKETKRTGRRLRSLADSTTSPLAPRPIVRRADEVQVPSEEEELYAQHARRIFEVINSNPMEARVRTMEAVSAIKRYSPLTCPRDPKIIERLDMLVDELAAQAPVPPRRGPERDTLLKRATRIVDDFVGQVIDSAKTKSLGDIDSVEEPEQ